MTKAEQEAKDAKKSEAKQSTTAAPVPATTTDTASGANPTPYLDEREGGPGPSAATLEEALAQQDELNRQASEDAAAESGEAKADADAEAEAAIAEAGAAQEARDDEVYGRTPAEEPVAEA